MQEAGNNAERPRRLSRPWRIAIKNRHGHFLALLPGIAIITLTCHDHFLANTSDLVFDATRGSSKACHVSFEYMQHPLLMLH
jgi:hypothetical protein